MACVFVIFVGKQNLTSQLLEFRRTWVGTWVVLPCQQKSAKGGSVCRWKMPMLVISEAESFII